MLEFSLSNPKNTLLTLLLSFENKVYFFLKHNISENSLMKSE